MVFVVTVNKVDTLSAHHNVSVCVDLNPSCSLVYSLPHYVSPRSMREKRFGDSLQGVPKPEVVVISAKERVNIGAIMPAV